MIIPRRKSLMWQSSLGLCSGRPLALGLSLRKLLTNLTELPKVLTDMRSFFESYPILTSALGHTINSELKLDLIGTLVINCGINILHSSTFGYAPMKELRADTAARHHCTALRLGLNTGIRNHSPARYPSLPSPNTPPWSSLTLRHPDTEVPEALLSIPLSCLPITQHPWSHLSTLLAMTSFKARSFCWVKPFSHLDTQLGRLDSGCREMEGVHNKGAWAFQEGRCKPFVFQYALTAKNAGTAYGLLL